MGGVREGNGWGEWTEWGGVRGGNGWGEGMGGVRGEGREWVGWGREWVGLRGGQWGGAKEWGEL